MSQPLPVARLYHADWSSRPEGRWGAWAHRRSDGGWRAEAPDPVAQVGPLLERLLVGGPTLAGFDFPLGLPLGYGLRTRLPDFPAALFAFGTGAWQRFYDVASGPDEGSLARPFYPARPGAALRQHLTTGHGVADLAALTRRCERGGPGRKAAGCLFWTLGGNQVGKAMLAGWRDLVVPARQRGARLWPFDGALDELATNGLTLAETYPADVYARLGVGFARASKRRHADRVARGPALLAWAERHGVDLAPPLAAAIRDGFGERDRGGDAFDAVAGLFGMIDVADGHHPAGAPDSDDVHRWEGWILGRAA